MKSIITNLFIFLLTTPVFAEIADRNIYYIGTEVHHSLLGKPETTDILVVKKSYLPSQNIFSEMACVKKEYGTTMISPFFAKIQGNTITEISSNKTFTSSIFSGNGTLEGTPWDWNYFKLSINYKTSEGFVRIEDENWVVGSRLVAIKEVYWHAFGSPPEIKSEIITAKVNEVSELEYTQKLKELDCPKN